MNSYRDSDVESDIEMEDMRGIAEGMGRKRKKTGIGSPSKLVLMVIIIICLIAVFAVFANMGTKVTVDDINPIVERLGQLEKRETNTEAIEKNISQLTKQVEDLQDSVSKLEQDKSSISKEIGNFNKQLSLIKTSNAPAQEPKKTVNSNPVVPETKKAAASIAIKPVEKKPPAQPKKVFHDVKQGDTLFGIARKYGLSIDELCSLNNFSRDQNICPGQQVIVK